MEKLEHFATAANPLLVCSICRCLIREAVLLKCLHSCCRQCFSTAVSKDGCRVGCGLCGAATHVGSEQPNGFIDCQVQRYMMIFESGACGKCRENGECNKPAIVWCPTCRHSLCGDCVTLHRQYNRQHVTQPFEELKSLDEVCPQPSAGACAIHNKPLDIVCLNCELPKCTSCWANCKDKKHEVHIVSEESFDRYVSSLISGISSIESVLLQKSAVLEQPKSVLRERKAVRDRHLEDLMRRKRCVVDAVEKAYEEMVMSMKDAYDGMEAECVTAADAAERIACDLSNAQSYVRSLVESNDKCEIFKQQKIVRERLKVLSAELDTLSDRLATATREVTIQSSLPDNVEDVVRTWIGIPRTYSASYHPPRQQQQQSYSFGAASASYKLPVHCWDVALTKDRHSMLLSAWEHGLIELGSCGHELSRWRPPKLSSSSQEEMVLAVAALSDGRAAVSVPLSQLVVLLRRSRNGGSSIGGAAATAAAGGSSTWTEDSRIDTLPWPVRYLAAHGDVLAASERRLDNQTNTWGPGPHLQLLSLKSGRRLSAELQRQYDIRSLAVATRAVVTGSSDKVELGSGRRAAYLLDAHTLTNDGSDERLWRHVLSHSDEEEEVLLPGVCLDCSSGLLYAAVCRSDWGSGCVSELSLMDGSELRRFVLSFSSAAAATRPPLLLPALLSLSEDGAVSTVAPAQQQQQSGSRRTLLLAALWWDATTRECRTVTLHRSTSGALQ